MVKNVIFTRMNKAANTIESTQMHHHYIDVVSFFQERCMYQSAVTL